jgi:hypothetical protein
MKTETLDLRNTLSEEVIRTLAGAIARAKEAIGRKGDHSIDDWEEAERILMWELYVRQFIRKGAK